MNYKAIDNSRKEEIIKHFGVKGMKWGVKNTAKKVASKASKSNANSYLNSWKVNRSNAKAYRNRSQMSDDELRRRTNRLNLENNYKDAVNRSRGRSEVGQAFKSAATKAVVTGAVAAAASYGLSKSNNPTAKAFFGALTKKKGKSNK